jgi:hypothetical protein
MSKKWFELALEAPCDTRHVLGISGGKDSAALAVYIKDHYPNLAKKMEYFFTDTGAELKEVYDTLDKLEAYLGKPISRLSSKKDFKHWLNQHDGMLPSVKARWCTRVMKIKPFEKFVGNDPVISYVGIRADENREGYISKKLNIQAVFPFSEDGIVRADVFRMLEESIGIPEYYQWRSRSGCYFCFFQQQKEWLGLKEEHPKLFEKAVAMEKSLGERTLDWEAAEQLKVGYGYTWHQSGTLEEIVAKAEKKRAENNGKKSLKAVKNLSWQDILKSEQDDDPEDQACLICSL